MRFKRKKVRKYRGSKTHGGGSMKKRRGSGHRGGRGMAGTGKRADTKKPTIINLYGNDYFGKFGFTSKSRVKIKAINIGKLQELYEKGIVKNDIILSELGYNKLLGSGLVNIKFNIKVDFASKGAIEKIKKAGGNVEVLEKKEWKDVRIPKFNC